MTPLLALAAFLLAPAQAGIVQGTLVTTDADTAKASSWAKDGSDVQHLVDSRLLRGWYLSVDDVPGAILTFTLPEPAVLTHLVLYNGSWVSPKHWKAVHHLAALTVSLDGGPPQPVSLPRDQRAHEIRFPEPVKASTITLRLERAHDAEDWMNDAELVALSEVQVHAINPSGTPVVEAVTTSSARRKNGPDDDSGDKVLDGLVDTMWCLEDGAKAIGAWIEVDFGAPTPIGGVTVHNGRTDASPTEARLSPAITMLRLSTPEGFSHRLTLSPLANATAYDLPDPKAHVLRLTVEAVASGLSDERLCVPELTFTAP
jgi:hypothetical protein